MGLLEAPSQKQLCELSVFFDEYLPWSFLILGVLQWEKESEFKISFKIYTVKCPGPLRTHRQYSDLSPVRYGRAQEKLLVSSLHWREKKKQKTEKY